MTVEEVVAACETAKRWQTASVCVRPCDVGLAAGELQGTAVKVGTVIGFPHGSTHSMVKVQEAERALADGAVELDMVMTVGRFLSGEWEYVENDIRGVVRVAHERKALVKVILEVCYLSDVQIAEACKIAEGAGADFVKTSTGFGSGGATPEAVGIMVATVGVTMGVKASGGIKTFDQAVGYLRQGCQRLGVGATEALLRGQNARDTRMCR
jgi:deoxyribose-phosphate aldolase